MCRACSLCYLVITPPQDDAPSVVLEGLVYSYFLYLACMEGSQIYSTCRRTGSMRAYVTDAWNLTDWMLIVFSFAALALRLSFFLDPIVRPLMFPSYHPFPAGSGPSSTRSCVASNFTHTHTH